MKVFGLTGGIGMGKSAAGRLLEQRGVPVVDTDVLARQVVEAGQPAFQDIQETFGREIVGTDGQLCREELARIVFSDPAARRKVEAATHPRIRELWRKQIESWRGELRPMAVVIIPLLFEIGAETEVDKIVCVACSAASQQQRLRERGWDDSHIAQRIAAQWPVEKKVAQADYVVWTEGRLDVLAEQLALIFRAG